MKKLIYVEEEIKKHKRTIKLINKFKDPEIITINKYTEVFNKRNQFFNAQKQKPALIIAKKYKNFLNRTPLNYGIGNSYNYYFSYMYNCIFDCKYCFLQGLYTSANFVVFINYEDFFLEIKKKAKELSEEKVTFFSGYDCDSLAYEPFSNFMKNAIDNTKSIKNIELEVRTKSTYIKPFLKNFSPNIIIAFSFTPENFSKKYEIGVPQVSKRIKALKKLATKGWKIGLRFDPIVVYKGWQTDYDNLFKILFNNLRREQIHSVSYGNLRFPKHIYKKIVKNNPYEKLFFNLIKNNNSYESNQINDINEYCKNSLNQFIEKEKIFSNF